MRRILISLLLFCALSLVALRPAMADITIDTVFVGNAGNAGELSGAGAGGEGPDAIVGAVDYNYRIGRYEVTNAQYAEFLNAKATSDPLALYDIGMDNNARGGIIRSGSSPNFSYAVKMNMGNKPVNYTNWFDAIRFANWLNNGQGMGDTETGAYTLGPLNPDGTPVNGSSITRNVGATWFLPNENEWYKAAYYQPAAEGGDVDNYWLYPTSSNSVPTIATANSVGDISNPGLNVANHSNGADWNNLNGNVTTVGSPGPLSKSFYGTSDQAGNVSESTETLINGSFRGGRGGRWFFNDNGLRSSDRLYGTPTIAFGTDGFRVATVPETSGLVLAATAGLLGVGLVVRRKRDRVGLH